MMPLNLTTPPRSVSPFLSPLTIPKTAISLDCRFRSRSLNQLLKKQHPLRGRGICRAELSQDAPFAIAIGSCILNSLLFPYVGEQEQEQEQEEEDNAAIGTTDARFAVMSVITFIPYFNWLSWIFAWMDTGKPRYAVYAAVYLAPYLRTNLSLSPEESWLPIASIVLCIIHVQLEASIRNGDIDGFGFLNGAAKRLGLIARSKDDHYGRQRTHEGRRSKSKNMNLPLGKAQQTDEIQNCKVPRKPSQDVEHGDVDDKMEH